MSEESEIRTEIRQEGFGDTTVLSDGERATPWTALVFYGIKGAALGVMLVLGVLAALCIMEFEGGESFAGWVGLQGHNLLVKPGMGRLKAIHGEDAEYDAPGYVKSYYVLRFLIGIGLALGVLAGLSIGLARVLPERRGTGGIALASAAGGLAGVVAAYLLVPKPKFLALGLVAGLAASLALSLLFRRCRPAPEEGEDEPSDGAPCRLPRLFPLGVAVVGLFWQGFIWGNVAILSLTVTRRRKWWITGATWVVAFTAVFLWAWALQTLWEEGWSKQIPPGIKEWIYWLGHMCGMKE
jgi:hypothetical protein